MNNTDKFALDMLRALGIPHENVHFITANFAADKPAMISVTYEKLNLETDLDFTYDTRMFGVTAIRMVGVTAINENDNQ